MTTTPSSDDESSSMGNQMPTPVTHVDVGQLVAQPDPPNEPSPPPPPPPPPLPPPPMPRSPSPRPIDGEKKVDKSQPPTGAPLIVRVRRRHPPPIQINAPKFGVRRRDTLFETFVLREGICDWNMCRSNSELTWIEYHSEFVKGEYNADERQPCDYCKIDSYLVKNVSQTGGGESLCDECVDRCFGGNICNYCVAILMARTKGDEDEKINQ